MAALDQEQIRAIEQTRQRLQTLSTSLNALRSDLATSQQPLPSWSSLQTHANLISNSIQAISSQLAEHQQLLSSTITFPLPQFPSSHANVLETLLRTKLEPNVEEWVEQGQKIAKDGAETYGLSDQDRNELWQWAPQAANGEARKQTWGADYTLAEKKAGIENVATGLRRELEIPADPADGEEDEEESEYEYEDEEPADKMDVEDSKTAAQKPGQKQSMSNSSQPQMPLEIIHKFMTAGKVG